MLLVWPARLIEILNQTVLRIEFTDNIFLILEGPIVCETVYETECQTSYHLHEVEEDVPKCETQMVCTKLIYCFE